MANRSIPITLKLNLADSPITRPLRDGRVTSDLVRFEFCGPAVAHEGFKALVAGDTFDGGELALATLLQARSYGRRLSLLPAVMSGGLHHTSISYNAQFGPLAPRDIEGRRVAVRSYSQTTGIWVRGFLSEDFGVDLSRVTWVCSGGAHVPEYRDPPGVEHAEPGSDLGQMLVDGEVAAFIIGVEGLPKGGDMRPLIPDPARAAQTWRDRHGTVPINHLFVLNSEIVEARPDVARETYRMLSEAKRIAGTFPRSDYYNFGFDANARAIDLFCRLSQEQGIVSDLYRSSDLYEDATVALEGFA
ncbi:phosphate ABC transporter substrate-binding protein [Sphingomonas oryzagri]